MKISCKSARSGRCAFTLVEVMLAVTLFSMILLTVMGLFVSLLRISQSVIGASTVSVDAANAVQRITQSLREARSVQLMDGGTFGSTYNAVDGGGNVVAVTGLRIFYPVTNPTITVNTTSSGTPITLSGNKAIYDRSSPGSSVDFFRANPDGTPNASSGTCLWISGVENGITTSRAIIRNLAPIPTAVQFIQPYLSDGVTPIPNEVKIKIVCSAYDRIHGTTTSDSTAGVQVQLTGESVYLRDHDPNGETSTGAHGRIQN